MITDIIVWSVAALTLAFVAAWAVSPALRDWIERPKYRFLDDVACHDRRRAARGGGDQGMKEHTT